MPSGRQPGINRFESADDDDDGNDEDASNDNGSSSPLDGIFGSSGSGSGGRVDISERDDVQTGPRRRRSSEERSSRTVPGRHGIDTSAAPQPEPEPEPEEEERRPINPGSVSSEFRDVDFEVEDPDPDPGPSPDPQQRDTSPPVSGLEDDTDRQAELDERVRVVEDGSEVAVSTFVASQTRELEEAGLQRDEFAIRFDEESEAFTVDIQEERFRRRREREAPGEFVDDIDAQLDADITESDLQVTEGQVELTTDARQRIAFERLDTQIEDRTLAIDDVRFDNGSAELTPDTERELAADRLDRRLEDVAIGPEDLERTDDGFSVQIEREQATASQRLRDYATDIRDEGILVDDPLDVRPTSTEFEIVRPELFRSPAEIQAGTRDLSREILATRVRGEAEVGRTVEQRIEDGEVTRDDAVLAGTAVATRVNPAARAAAVSAAAVGVTQVDRPDPTSPTEVEVSEEVVDTTRVGVPDSVSRDLGEVSVPETGDATVTEIDAPESAEPVTETEIGIPDSTPADPTDIRLSEAITPTIPGTDLPSPAEPSLPDVTEPSVSRDDAVERTFPTGGSAVIGRQLERLDEQLEVTPTSVTDTPGEFVTPTVPSTPPAVREIGVPGIDDSIDQNTNALNRNLEQFDTGVGQQTGTQPLPAASAVVTPTITAVSTPTIQSFAEPTVPAQDFVFDFAVATPTIQPPRTATIPSVNIPEFDFGALRRDRRRRDRDTFERRFEIDVPDPLGGVTGSEVDIPGSNVPSGGMGG